MARILVVDDEPSICWGLAKLGERLEHEVVTASTAERGLEELDAVAVDLIILDVRLPGMDGLTAMEKMRAKQAVPIVIITAYGDLETAVRAVRQGAFEYIVKPFDLEKAESVIKRALRQHAQVDSDAAAGPPIEGIVGKTPVMQEVFRRIALVADSDASVLLQGESGTGKELVARAIHRYSRRCDGPFVAVNVASLSTSLAESELFGHVRGAFTGADYERTGLLVQAHGGTLFLDEVADIPLPTQVKLLRALEQGEVTPVGSSKSVQTDFRVISATHQNLQARVEDGSFRHDLFYRLCAFQIDLPALRERQEDIRLLADHFVEQFAGSGAANSSPWSVEALTELQKRPWYGNVRELRNAVEHALILARDGAILPEHLPPPVSEPLVETSGIESGSTDQISALVRRWAELQLADDDSAAELYERLLGIVEPPLLAAALEKHRQCASAARRLGMHRTTLRKKLDQYGLDPS